MNVPAQLKYSPSHEWVSVGDVCKCGITDYAQHELSDIVFVELPEVGRSVKKGETMCVVESVKAASDIYAPISGVITDVNMLLEKDPAAVNNDPYGSGWLCTITPADKKELSQLLSSQQYTEHLNA